MASGARHVSRLGRLGECYSCVTTEARHLDLLGQLGEFEQDSNTGSVMCVTAEARYGDRLASVCAACAFVQ